MIRRHRKVKTSSLRFQVIAKSYQLWPDGRKVALETNKGREWYRSQVLEMAASQDWKCGLESCREPNRLMDDPEINPQSVHCATFEHGDKRGMGGARRNDDIHATGNCAAHWICNAELGSRRK